MRVGRAIAYVLCGGDGPPRDVTEQDLLDLEREQFLSLLGTKETQERIALHPQDRQAAAQLSGHADRERIRRDQQ